MSDVLMKALQLQVESLTRQVQQLAPENERVRQLLTDFTERHLADEGRIAATLARAERAEAELAKLADPNAVHVSMLAGTVAKPSWQQIKHIYAEEAERAEAALAEAVEALALIVAAYDDSTHDLVTTFNSIQASRAILAAIPVSAEPSPDALVAAALERVAAHIEGETEKWLTPEDRAGVGKPAGEYLDALADEIRALTPAPAREALDAAIAAAVKAERDRCAAVVRLLEGRDMTGTGCQDPGEGYDLALTEAADAILAGDTP